MGVFADRTMERGTLFDIDGVLVTSWAALPGAVDAVGVLADHGVPRRFLTNTTSRSRDEIAELLTGCGFVVDAAEILTAATLTAQYLRATHPGRRVWVLNEGPIAGDMAGLEFTDDLDAAQVIVLGGAGPVFTHDALSSVLRRMIDGVPVVAMHRSLIWSTVEGLRVDTGVYLEGLESAAGQSIHAIGKPSPLGFRTAVELMGLDPGQVVMIGDDMHNDVLAAQAVGLQGVLVRTGKFRPEALGQLERDEFGQVPHHVIDSVADLPALLGF